MTITQRQFIQDQVDQCGDELFDAFGPEGSGMETAKADSIYARLHQAVRTRFPELSEQECIEAIGVIMSEMCEKDAT